MSVMDYETIESTCSLFAKGFEDIERRLQYWCVEKRPYNVTMNSLCKLDGNSGCEYYPLWFSHQAQTYAFASILCNSDVLGEWKKSQRRLSDEAEEAVSFWLGHPAIWCYFTITERFDHDLYMISDRLTGASLLLCSPFLSMTLEAKPEEVKKHFIALLAPNGQCYQSFGVIHSNNLGASDLDFFATMLDQQDYMTRGFSQVVNKNYIDFLGIDEVTYVPSMVHGGTWLKVSFNQIRIENFPIDGLVGQWDVQVKGNAIRATLTGSGGKLDALVENKDFWKDLPFSRPSLFLDKRDGSGWIMVMGKQNYNDFIRIIRNQFPRVPLDKVIVPDYTVSPAMLHLVTSQKRKAPWQQSLKPFNDMVVNEETRKNEELIVSHSRSLGTHSFFAHGLSTLKDGIGLTMGKGPVRIGNRLLSPFDRSMLFTINHQEPLFKSFVKAWNKSFPNAKVELLNLFLLLLWYHCGCYKPVSSYAFELEKQLPDRTKFYPDFAKRLCSFVYTTMKDDGFIMLEEEKSDRIRPTLLFAKTIPLL